MQQMQSIQKIERDLSNRLKSTKEKPKKHEQAKVKAGTKIDLLKLIGQVKDQLSKVGAPALTFTLGSIRAYWNAFWGGHTLPLRLKIDDQVDKEIFVGRLAFATTFIIADSVYLVGKFGIWLLQKVVGKINVINALMVGGLIVGFLGWVYPWFLSWIGVEVENMKIVGLLVGYRKVLDDMVRVPDVDLVWIPMIGIIGVVLVSVKRFKRWRGLKLIMRRKESGCKEDHQDR